MPVEIKELVIKVTADGGGTGSAAAATAGEREVMVQECVQQVLRVLKRKKER